MSSAVPVEAKLLAAQREAIGESGWAERFQLWQPRNAAFWVWLLGVVAGLLLFVREVARVPNVYGPAMVAGVVVWSLFVIPWIVFLRHKDRYAPAPGLLAAAGFLWGGLAATFAISVEGNGALLGIYAKVVSPEFAARWGTALSAPVVEESAKACGIVLLIALAPRLVRSAWDGLILGAFVGLGFQVFENWLYTVQGASSNLGENQAATVFGMALIWLIGRPAEPRRPLRGILLIAAAVAAHAVWNAVVGLGLLAFAMATGVLVVIAVVFAERAAATRERGWMRDLMAPEVARGTIGEPELDALAGHYAHRRRYIKSAPGRAGRRRARQVIDASLDLAEDIARSGGRETPEVASARGEVVRVRAAR